MRSRCVLVFLFKQKTAYEMRISDWSSDVCSSDLIGVAGVTGGYTCLTTRMAGEAHGRTSVTTRATIFTRGGAAIATGLATCAHGCTDLTSRLRTAAEGAALCTRCQGHFIGIDDAVAVLVGPATHGGGALADGSAVIEIGGAHV